MKERLSAALRILIPPAVVHRQPLLIFVVAAVTGILLDSAVDASILVWTGTTALLVAGFGIIRLSKESDRLATILVVLIIVPLAALWHQIQRRSYDSASILQHTDVDPRPVILDGVVDRPVVLRRHPMADQSWRGDQSPWQTQIEIQSNQIRSGLDWRPVDGRVLAVVSGRRDQLRPGDSVRVYGSIEQFDRPGNPGEQDFRDVYRRRGIHARVQVNSESQIENPEPSGWRLGRWIASIARSGRERLLKYMGSDTGPLAIALVIGQREFVGPDQRDQLLVTGTVHLLSVSGLHLAIVVVLANWTAILLRFPPFAKVAWIIAICMLYTAVTGGRPPVIRAAVLVATFLVAFVIKRPSQPINTLSLAALIILVWNPELIFGVGVQLSFLAVATLLLCRPGRSDQSPAVAQAVQQEDRLAALAEQSRSQPMIHARAWASGIWTGIWYSLCVTAISMPLVWYNFHVVSPISVVANVVLSPFLFAALATGVATVVFGVIPPLGWLFGMACDYSIQAMRGLIDLAASIPLGHLWLPSPPAWWVLCFYAVIWLSLYLHPGRFARGVRCAWIIGWVITAGLMATTSVPLDEGSIEATFVDVGHGTSVVLRSDDQVWLYDCGRLGNDSGRSRDIDATLWSQGVTHLDGILLSHADADHFNALPGVLRRFSVDQIVTPPAMLDDPEPAVVKLRRSIQQWQIPIREVASGTFESIGRHPASVLHPPVQRIAGTDNANSLVLRIDCGGTSLILPGDLEPPGTAAVIEQPRPRPGGVLMAPHHGSLRMDAASVLNWSRPGQTIVSGGRRAKRPEVYQMLSARGSGVHVTSQLGAIRVLISETGKIEVRRWRHEPW